jgi:hypothetical protein
MNSEPEENTEEEEVEHKNYKQTEKIYENKMSVYITRWQQESTSGTGRAANRKCWADFSKIIYTKAANKAKRTIQPLQLVLFPRSVTTTYSFY